MRVLLLVIEIISSLKIRAERRVIRIRGKHKRCAVKVIDPRGNEVMRVHRLDGKTTY